MAAETKKANAGKSGAPGHKVHRRRIYLLLTGFILVYCVIGIRLVRLQADPDVRFNREDLAHIGSIEIHRPRGDIVDRRGVILATDRHAQTLCANPSVLEDPGALIAFLTSRLGVDRALLEQRFGQRTRSGQKMKFIIVKEDLTDAELSLLGDFTDVPDGKALMVQRESRRYYPNGDLASHVLGFANKKGEGAEGVELSYDRYLRSHPGKQVSRVDRNRKFLEFATLEFEPATGGDSVELTLDAEFQYRLEQALDHAMLEREAPRAMGVLMDPDTGAILALATRPAFDPNTYNEYTAEIRKNRAIVDVFEPGSSFKIVTAAAALELGFITPDDLIDCEGGRFNPYGHSISDTHPHGVIPFSQCFAESSNIATIKVAAILGPERLESWITRFGFGTRTGVDLPIESAGLLGKRTNWSRLTMGSLPIGQEIAVTMLQLAQAFSAIANGGYLVQPHLVARASSQEGMVTYEYAAAAGTRILSEETAAMMRALCHGVVSGKESTGRYAVIPEYRVGGKTGTAQIARTDGRGYEKSKYTAVFAGFAPVADPRLTCVIVVQEPKYGTHWGGHVSGPVFKEVVRDALIRLHVPKDPMPGYVEDKQEPPSTRDDADTMVARVELDLAEPSELGLDDLALPLLELRPIEEDLREAGPTLPNLSGLTRREAKEVLATLGLPWDPRGAGRVVEQYPPAGTLLSNVTVCQLVFGTVPAEIQDEV